MMALLRTFLPSGLLPAVTPILFSLLAFVIGWGGGAFVARHEATAQCRADALENELRELKRQLALNREITEAADERAEDDAHALMELEGKLKEYEDATSFKTSGNKTSCALDADDALRLRDIR